jgi:hypothetical protein
MPNKRIHCNAVTPPQRQWEHRREKTDPEGEREYIERDTEKRQKHKEKLV